MGTTNVGCRYDHKVNRFLRCILLLLQYSTIGKIFIISDIFFRVVERGRTKCAQYWGPEPGDEVQAGGFTVTTLEVDTNPDYTISMLLLTNKKVCSI